MVFSQQQETGEREEAAVTIRCRTAWPQKPGNPPQRTALHQEVNKDRRYSPGNGNRHLAKPPTAEKHLKKNGCACA